MPGASDEAAGLFARLEGGRWGDLGGIEAMDLATRSDRSQLVLVRLAHRLQAGDLEGARKAIAEGLRWGVPRRLLSQVVAAGAHEDLRAARELAAQPEAAAGHLEQAVSLLQGLARAPSTEGAAGGKPAGGQENYRDEVLRQRKLIAELRAAIHSRGAQDDAAGEDASLIARILARRLTYLTTAKLACVARTCRAIEEQRIPGVFLEAGCALGGSAILIASIKRPERPLRVYDVFGMIPAPGPEDTPDVHERYHHIVEGLSQGIGGDRYYGYEANLFEVVKSNLRHFEIDAQARHVELIKGLVQDTLTETDPVAFAHIDLDWFDPVDVCLRRIYPRLSIGGSIVVDDYHDWGGCRRAVDAFLQEVGGTYAADDSARSLKITRLRGGPTS
jgi:asparagine synthase (glutamine-hydrolysing)